MDLYFRYTEFHFQARHWKMPNVMNVYEIERWLCILKNKINALIFISICKKYFEDLFEKKVRTFFKR